MAKGELLAEGRTAEIFAWGPHEVLKLLRPGFPADDMAHEAWVTAQVHALRVPVPAVLDRVELDGRPGIIFERVSGPSLLHCIAQRPWRLLPYAHLLADLHADLHTRTIPDLPAQRLQLSSAISQAPTLPVALKEGAWAALARLPDGDVLCHGDFHPDNVVLTARGPVILDWLTACRGNPLADVMRTSLLLRLGAVPPGTPGRLLITTGCRLFHALYIRRYLARRALVRRDLAAWQGPVAAARLAEQIAGEERALLRIVAAGVPRCGICGP